VPRRPRFTFFRAKEARYFKRNYGHMCAVWPATEAQATVDWVHRILTNDRDVVVESRPPTANESETGGIRFRSVFYESGPAINVM
jgi:hypothetical protein